jgi:hypothetical protein
MLPQLDLGFFIQATETFLIGYSKKNLITPQKNVVKYKKNFYIKQPEICF